MKDRTKLILVILIAAIVILVTYKIYAPYPIQNFNAVNLKNIKRIKSNLPGDSFSFVVLGNIKNSISIFDKNILKELRTIRPEFIISTGNNVVDSGHGKYRILNRTLQDMKIPFITSVGENEIGDEGHKNFYKYFGPFYFSFAVEDTYFIFLDSTGHSSDMWQNEWLLKELKAAQNYQHRFVVMNKPPLEPDETLPEDIEDNILSRKKRNYYRQIFSRYDVTAVFSSGLPLYHRQEINGVNYIISGGAGGELLIDNPQSFYHYVQVQVDPAGIDYKVKKLESNPGFFVKLTVNLWVGLQSFLYTNYLNLIIIALILFMAGFLFYRELNRKVDYYSDFRYAAHPSGNEKLKIAMFTNNYFPVIGGVPISIERLSSRLRKLGHEVYIFAPDYPDKTRNDNEYIIRCKLLYYFQKNGMEMPICNIFSGELAKRFGELDIDIVHCHHPFLLGVKGRNLARQHGIPAVFTYHTRLEKYSHYLPGFLFIRRLFENRLSHLLIRRFANKCTAIITPTESTKEYLRKIGVKRYIKILPTGVNLKNYNYVKEDLQALKNKYQDDNQFLLLTVSRLSPEKNLYFLLDGLKKIKEKTDKNFKCLIIGDGAEKEKLKDYAVEIGLKKNVDFVGRVDFQSISRYYLIADIFVFASTTETQGMVLLEAMAGNTPVVAVRSSGTDDVIENNFNGFKTAEDTEQWAAKIVQLMENKELLYETSENARKMADKYSVENMALEAEALYRKLTGYR